MHMGFAVGTEIDDRVDAQLPYLPEIFFAGFMQGSATEQFSASDRLPIGGPDPAQVAEILDMFDLILSVFLHRLRILRTYTAR